MKYFMFLFFFCIGLVSFVCGSDFIEGDGGLFLILDGVVGDIGTFDVDLMLLDVIFDVDVGMDVVTMDDVGSVCFFMIVFLF